MDRVIVVGGGLAGLVTARRLAGAGDRPVTLFETADTVGGRVRSRRRDGYVLDRGFQVLFTAYPAVRRELDLDALALRSFPPGATLCRPGRRSVLADPLRAPRTLPAALLNREVSTGDKLRLLALRRALARRSTTAIMQPDHDTDIRSYLAGWGFSEAFIDRFVAPFYGGITLDRSLTSSKLVFEYTFKMLATGEIAVPADGMGAITTQLAERARAAGATIETGRSVTAVEAVDATTARVTVDGERHRADGVVVATDPLTAESLTGVATPDGTRGCVTQYYSLPAAVDLDTGGRILLNVAETAPNQVVSLSAVAPSYAPADRQLLAAVFLETDDLDRDRRTVTDSDTVTAPSSDRGDSAWPSVTTDGGATAPTGVETATGFAAPAERTDDALAARTKATLSAWYPDRAFDDLEVLATDRIPLAQFAQPPGFRATLPSVDAPDGPIALAGEYTRWSSINGAMESGRRAADYLLSEPPADA